MKRYAILASIVALFLMGTTPVNADDFVLTGVWEIQINTYLEKNGNGALQPRRPFPTSTTNLEFFNLGGGYYMGWIVGTPLWIKYVAYDQGEMEEEGGAVAFRALDNGTFDDSGPFVPLDGYFMFCSKAEGEMCVEVNVYNNAGFTIYKDDPTKLYGSSSGFILVLDDPDHPEDPDSWVFYSDFIARTYGEEIIDGE